MTFKKKQKLAAAFVIIAVTMIVSTACIADYYYSISRVEIIQPFTKTLEPQGEIYLNGESSKITNGSEREYSRIQVNAVYTEDEYLVSKIEFNIYSEDAYSYDVRYINLDKHTLIPKNSVKIPESQLVRQDLSHEYMNKLWWAQLGKYSIYALEKDGIKYEFYMEDSASPRLQGMICEYNSMIFNEDGSGQIGRIHFASSEYSGGGLTGVPVDGKPVGPWTYTLTETSSGAQAILNVECVSSYRVADANNYLYDDADVSKVCRVTLTDAEGKTADPVYVKFYQSGMIDERLALMNNTRYSYFEEKIGHTSGDRRYVSGDILIVMECGAYDPKTTAPASILVRYSISEMTYDENGIVVSTSAEYHEYKGVLHE